MSSQPPGPGVAPAASKPIPTRAAATALTPELVERLTGLLRLGNYVETACRACSLSMRVFYEWMQRGSSGEEPFATFALMVDEALAIAEVSDVATIRKAATGYDHVVTETREGPEGTTTVTRSSRQFDWRAGAWRLERRYRARWAPRSTVPLHVEGAMAPPPPAEDNAPAAATSQAAAPVVHSPARAASLMRELFGPAALPSAAVLPVIDAALADEPLPGHPDDVVQLPLFPDLSPPDAVAPTTPRRGPPPRPVGRPQPEPPAPAPEDILYLDEEDA